MHKEPAIFFAQQYATCAHSSAACCAGMLVSNPHTTLTQRLPHPLGEAHGAERARLPRDWFVPRARDCRVSLSFSLSSSHAHKRDTRSLVRTVDAVKKAGVIMAIGHVMRYTPYSRKIKQIGTHKSLSVPHRTCGPCAVRQRAHCAHSCCADSCVQSIAVCWAN
jgi:hypothetical protein